jgi:acyl-homoserine-lactone acylase
MQILGRVNILQFLLPLILTVVHIDANAQAPNAIELKRWNSRSKNCTIIRDNWGIAHVYGKSDADAVFGFLYAQCEDDFARVELNYIEKLGRLSEVYGEKELYTDLMNRILLDSTEAIRDFNRSPKWLKELLVAFADGVNYYLYKNPQVQPALLNRFEPWFHLLWTDGSIGAINTAGIEPDDLKSFYDSLSTVASTTPRTDKQFNGSNGFAISKAKSISGNALLYINPHVTFFFRPEIHIVSNEGLNAYGAVTWGQMFIYQGFNENCGWMHTSSDVDVADLYEEIVFDSEDGKKYKDATSSLLLKKRQINIRFKSDNGFSEKKFSAYATHRGPILSRSGDKWISLKAKNRSLEGLIQSWSRTKSRNLKEYQASLDYRGNPSNNTVYADKQGNIAYWHGNFVPKRDTSFDWSKPVAGSNPATAWRGVHEISEIVHLINPVNGWLQNCNSTPFSVAGTNSPDRKRFPFYMAPDGENFRGVNAVRLLSPQTKLSIDSLIKIGYDNYMPAFEILVPALLKAMRSDTTRRFADVQELLTGWDYRSDSSSIASTIAIHWGEKLPAHVRRVYINAGDPDQVEATKIFADTSSPSILLDALQQTIQELTNRHGHAKIPWGQINRYQRPNTTAQEFDDNKPSLPSGYASSTWGTLPSFSSRYFPNTEERYGIGGNSFVCVVEFGKRVTAKSLLTGGVSGNPASKHFSDQAEMFVNGRFKQVSFYKNDVLKNAVRKYNPGN